MNETYNLELFFENEEGRSRKLTIRQPLEDLTEADVLPAMQTIVDTNIFDDDGLDRFAVAKNARYVRTVIDDVFEVEEA